SESPSRLLDAINQILREGNAYAPKKRNQLDGQTLTWGETSAVQFLYRLGVDEQTALHLVKNLPPAEHLGSRTLNIHQRIGVKALSRAAEQCRENVDQIREQI